ncbi:glycosyltransferase [Roseovarius mucosus]|uniref:glycosyltransferase n=1 Tax=Roseovarius mucosus TaxID=215743 RepID=UPI0035D07391
MQVRHLPNRDRRDGGVTTLKCASTHVPRFLTGSDPPISHRQLPFGHSIAQAVTTAHRRAAARNGFLGNHPDLHAHFHSVSRGKDVELHQWIEFNTVMPGLSSFLFLGGVGTIWHCLQNGVPMIVAPGFIGDQLENARRIAALGLGAHMAEDQPCEDIAAIAQRVTMDADIRNRLAEAREPASFSHTMDSFFELICDFVDFRVGLVLSENQQLPVSASTFGTYRSRIGLKSNASRDALSCAPMSHPAACRVCATSRVPEPPLPPTTKTIRWSSAPENAPEGVLPSHVSESAERICCHQ